MLNGEITRRKRTEYAMFDKKILPCRYLQWHASTYSADTVAAVYDYDGYGSPLHFRRQGEPHTFLQWFCNGNYIKQETIGNDHITRYEYNSSYNVSAVTDMRGYKTRFYYDRFGRLCRIDDNDSYTMSRIGYGYRSGKGNLLGVNFVSTETMLDTCETHVNCDYQLLDGLGRDNAAATNRLGTDGKYSYSLTEYDTKGRVRKQWLAASGNGSLNTDYIDASGFPQLSNTTYGDSKAYSLYEYDCTDRQTALTSPGEVWHNTGHKQSTVYGTNTDDEVKRYSAANNVSSLSCNGFYPACALDKKETTDEDGRVTQEYTDFLKRLVLRRQLSSADTLDTYYVYNGYGQLCFVLTPEYQAHGYKDLYGYEYNYDLYGRLEKRKFPGCGRTQFYYNDDNRQIGFKDPDGQKWFVLYDTYGRQVMKGTCSSFNTIRYHDVEMSDNDAGLYGTGYTGMDIAQISNGTPQEISFYDDYRFLSKTIFASNPNAALLRQDAHSVAKGLLTGQACRTSSGAMLLTVYYYDSKGRVIDRRQTTLDGGLYQQTTEYSFTDNPVKETAKLLLNGQTHIINKTYSYYENNDRLHTVSLSYNGQDTTVIATYSYDSLGRLSEKTHGGSAGSVSYTYNLRNWVTHITGRGFSEWLYYTNGYGTPYYSGNVSSIQWKVSSEDFMRGYKFYYDGFSRLTSAAYAEGSDFSKHNDRYSEWISEYTANGCIRKIERCGLKSDGKYGKIDNLRMYYTGMQVDSVKEDALPVTRAGAFDFVAGRLQGIGGKQYAYNSKGSMLWDANKGVSYIEYDSMDHPQRVQFYNGSATEFVYSSTGEKLRTIHHTAVPNIVVPVSEILALDHTNTLYSDTTEYIGDFVIENGSVRKYLFPGGYVTIVGSSTVKHYYVCDHLGSIRSVVNEYGGIEQQNHYYPFGAIYADAGYGSAVQPFKYNGKWLDRMHGFNLYDYGARMYDPLLCRFTQIDPLAEKYYGISPYVYCVNGPVNSIDPDGRSTWVANQGDGTYRVVGGDLMDNDRNIYVYSQDNNGSYTVRGESIGVSSSITSFFNSDAKGGLGAWAIGAIINPNDNSGKKFLRKMISEDITLDEYMDKARYLHPYDFKVTNGSSSVVSREDIYKYRGMSIGRTILGQMIYTSARDVGNIAAGAVAAKNGIPWQAARVAFDAYQGDRERIATQRAEYYGWSQVYSHSNGVTESVHLRNTINSYVKKMWNYLLDLW